MVQQVSCTVIFEKIFEIFEDIWYWNLVLNILKDIWNGIKKVVEYQTTLIFDVFQAE